MATLQVVAQQCQQHIVFEQLFQPYSNAFQHQRDVILYDCGLSKCLGTLITYQHVILLTSYLLNGTAHVLRGLRVVQVLTLTLLQQFLGRVDDVVNLFLATLTNDVLYPRNLQQSRLDGLFVTIKQNHQVCSQLQGRLVTCIHWGSVGIERVDVVCYRMVINHHAFLVNLNSLCCWHDAADGCRLSTFNILVKLIGRIGGLTVLFLVLFEKEIIESFVFFTHCYSY